MRIRPVAALLVAVTISASTVAATSPGASAPPSESETFADAGWKATVTELEAIGRTQTQADIDAFAASDEPVEFLVDSDTGEYLAARPTADDPSLRAIDWLAPGCSTTSACISAAGKPFGYQGSGRISLNHSQVTRVAAGDRLSTFWHTATVGTFVKAKASVNFTSPKKVTALTR